MCIEGVVLQRLHLCSSSLELYKIPITVRSDSHLNLSACQHCPQIKGECMISSGMETDVKLFQQFSLLSNTDKFEIT